MGDEYGSHRTGESIEHRVQAPVAAIRRAVKTLAMRLRGAADAAWCSGGTQL